MRKASEPQMTSLMSPGSRKPLLVAGASSAARMDVRSFRSPPAGQFGEPARLT